MERALQKISDVFQTFKDSLVVLKEAEETIEDEGPTNEALLQVSRIMRESVGKLIADVGPCVERKRRHLLEDDPKGKRKAVSDHVVRGDVNAKRRAVLNCGIVYGHGKHLEVMDPLLWGNLPVPLLELVFDRVTLKIHDSTQCQSLRLTDPHPPNKVTRLMYTNSGTGLLVLGSNAVHKFWKWPTNRRNHLGKGIASFQPQLWEPAHGLPLINDISGVNPEEAVHSIALSKNDSYIVSASGGMVSVINSLTFRVIIRCLAPSPAVTFLVFYPRDNNIIAVGMEDSTIQIYNLRVEKVMANLHGHQKRITGLAFSSACNVLVSSGADAQLCLWSTESWKKCCTKSVQVDLERSSQSTVIIHIEFHYDQVRFLVVHESQLAIYDAIELVCLQQWVCQKRRWAPISNATYSCDSKLVYAGFVDGSLAVFDATSLLLRCQLAPPVYVPRGVSGHVVYPLVIVAHPKKSNQFAMGLSDGGVQVIEPLKSDGEWGTLTILPCLDP